jgi:hypothetical protein
MGQAAPVAGNKNNRRSLDSPSKQPAASSPLSGGSLAALGASGELSAENVSTGRIKELLANAGKRLAVLNRGKATEVATVDLASDDDASAASGDAGIKQRNGNAPNGQADDAAGLPNKPKPNRVVDAVMQAEKLRKKQKFDHGISQKSNGNQPKTAVSYSLEKCC